MKNFLLDVVAIGITVLIVHLIDSYTIYYGSRMVLGVIFGYIATAKIRKYLDGRS